MKFMTTLVAVASLLGVVIPARGRIREPPSVGGRAVCGSRRPHRRHVLVAALAASGAPATSNAANLLATYFLRGGLTKDVFLLVEGTSAASGVLIGVMCLSRLWRPHGRQRPSRENLLGDVLPARWRVHGRLPVGRRAVRDSRLPHWRHGARDGACGLSGARGSQGGNYVLRRTTYAAARPSASFCWGKGRPRLHASSLAPGAHGEAVSLSGARGFQGGKPPCQRTPCATACPRASSCGWKGRPRLQASSLAPWCS